MSRSYEARGSTSMTTSPHTIIAPMTENLNGHDTPFWKRRNRKTRPRLRKPLRDAVESVRPAMMSIVTNPRTRIARLRTIWMNIQISRMLTLHMKASRFSFLPQEVVSDCTRNSVAFPVSVSIILPVATSSSRLVAGQAAEGRRDHRHGEHEDGEQDEQHVLLAPDEIDEHAEEDQAAPEDEQRVLGEVLQRRHVRDVHVPSVHE